MNGRMLAGGAALALALSLAGGTSAAAERITVAVGNFGNVAFLPYDAAVVLGYLEDEGLEVRSEYAQSGSQAAAAALAGSADFAAVTLDHAIKAHRQGRAFRMLAAFTEVPGMLLLVRSELRGAVRTLTDLKGLSVGVTGLGAGTHLTLNYVLLRAGLPPEAVDAVPVGYSGMAPALEGGRVNAIMTSGAQAAALVAAGRAFTLLDLTARARVEALFGGPCVETGLLATEGVIAGRPDVCRRVVRAIVRANHWIASHTPAQIAERLPGSMVGDRERYVAALEQVHDGYSRDGLVSIRAAESVVRTHRTLGLIEPWRRVDAARLIDNTFVEQALAEAR